MKTEIVSSVLKNVPIYVRAESPTACGHTAPLHIHDEMELLRVKCGSFCCTVNGTIYELCPGDIILITERTPHSTINLEENTDTQVLQFNPDYFSGETMPDTCRYLSRFINIDKSSVTVFPYNAPMTAELSAYFDAILNELTHHNTGYELYIKANILSILAFLSRTHILTDSSDLFDENMVKKILPALNYINDHYTEQITLQQISSVMNLNSSYFCRLFKQTTNSTFIEYVNFIRICKSEGLLLTRQDSVAQIAFEIGFSSVTYFNKIFKKYKGCTPTDYKKSKYPHSNLL